MENDKPKKLYRGITLNYNQILRYNFEGDLVPPPSNLYDEHGRKVVGDGNEYGLYMSDNYFVVSDCYGKDRKMGEIISNLVIDNQSIRLPSVGIIYEIDTNGLEIRKPFITQYLKCLENNGFSGNEWIADIVPHENYEYNRIILGSDILHDAEILNLNSGYNIKYNLIKLIKKRKQHLETMINELIKLSKEDLIKINGQEIEILKRCFGNNGIAYMDIENAEITNYSQMLDYLQFKSLRKPNGTLDFETLKYLDNLRKKALTIADIEEIIIQDKIKNQTLKNAFEKRKKLKNIPYSTRGFDIKNAMYAKLLILFNIAKKHITSKTKDTHNESYEHKTSKKN